MSAAKPRIGITLGDCAGIGPEIVDLALKSGRVPDSAEYVVIGRQPNCHPGEPTIETARAAAAALEEAVTLARRGKLDAIVTGPVHKARMYDIGFKFPGQTEFFAQRCGIKNFAMCLTAEKITVALVTTHIPLRKVPDALKQSEIVRVGLLLTDFLRSRSKSAARIAVAGLNPHAGESGRLGREEIDIIAPAISELSAIRSRADGIGETEGKAAMGSSERVGQRASFNPQSAIRRVKGAWWPSRSSKPSLPRKWRGRFDSYPLRQIIFDCRLSIADCPGTGRMISIANRNSKIENWLKGGESHVA